MSTRNGIWSALSVLESVDDAQPNVQSYVPKTFSDGDYHTGRYIQHHTLATALAFIAASHPNVKTVSCCAIEVKWEEGTTPIQRMTVRIAQNELVDEETLEDFRNMLNMVKSEIDKVDWPKFSSREGFS